MNTRSFILAAASMIPVALPAMAGTGLDSLAAAEKAFAASSVEKGMKTAFLANLADDAIIFRPGPVNGQQSWRARPDSKAELRWGPSYAELSGAGDLGFTTGPWEFRSAGAKEPQAYGHFVSVWRREPDGPWQVALDHGVSHAKPKEGGVGDITFRAGPTHAAPKPEKRPRSGFGVGGAVFSGGLGVGVGTATGPITERDYDYRRTAHEVNTMMSAERTFAFLMRTKGAPAAYGKQAAEDLRFYRDEVQPSLGKTAAIAALGEGRRDRAWSPSGSGVAKSWDMGYSYGIVTAADAKGGAADSSAYVHLWRKNPAGEWKMAFEVETPFPKPEK